MIAPVTQAAGTALNGLPAAGADLVGQLGWQAWQASVTGLLALGLAALLRRRAPRAAALIAALALLKFVIPPVVRFPFAFGDTAAVLINPVGALLTSDDAASRSPGLIDVVAFCWVAIAAGLALGVVRHARDVHRIRRAARPIADGPALEAMAKASAALRPRRPAALRVSDAADGPFATGVWRPVIVLPRRLVDRLEPDALAIVIGHELAHHRRRDLPVAWCAALATTIFWFSPVVWLLARMVRELREECCDADVAGRGLASPAAYADALVAAAGISAGASALPMRDRHPLARRLRYVLAPLAPLPAPLAMGGVLVFGLLCLPSSPSKPLWSFDNVVRVQRTVDVRKATETPEASRERRVERRP